MCLKSAIFPFHPRTCLTSYWERDSNLGRRGGFVTTNYVIRIQMGYWWAIMDYLELPNKEQGEKNETRVGFQSKLLSGMSTKNNWSLDE